MNYIIIYKIIRNIIIIIIFIFIFFLFIIYIIKKISFRIVNFNVIKNFFFFFLNIKLRDFQIIKKRRFLINKIINKIVILRKSFQLLHIYCYENINIYL